MTQDQSDLRETEGAPILKEKMEKEYLLEAKRHIFPIPIHDYAMLTGRALTDVDFILMTAVGEVDDYESGVGTIANRESIALNRAISSMYTQMVEQGIEYAVGFEIIRPQESLAYPHVIAIATGFKKRQDSLDSTVSGRCGRWSEECPPDSRIGEKD